MTGTKSGGVVRIFVDAQNFLERFAMGNPRRTARLLEVDWPALQALVVEVTRADRFDRLLYYDAFPGGEIPSLERLPTVSAQVLAGVLRDPHSTVVPGVLTSFAEERPGRSAKRRAGDRTFQKAVDTTMTAHIVRGACLNEFDVAVIFSEDYDFQPAASEVLQSGKRVYFAVWGSPSVSTRLQRFVNSNSGRAGFIDLRQYTDRFVKRSRVLGFTEDLTPEQYAMWSLIRALQRNVIEGRAEHVYFDDLFGEYSGLPSDPAERAKILEQLLVAKIIEKYGVGQRNRTAYRLTT